VTRSPRSSRTSRIGPSTASDRLPPDQTRGRRPELLQRLERRYPEELAKAAASAFTEDGTRTDPLGEARGHDGIVAAITGAHEQFPGFEFKPTCTPDAHHNLVRFT
jgi:hypothetical protein